MSKLTEKMNAFKISPELKNAILKIADEEELAIQQVARMLLRRAIKMNAEITDEEIAIAADSYLGNFPKQDNFAAFIEGAEWYRKQLKKLK